MSSATIESLAPLAAALPDPPTELPFTEANWRTLLAIMDTIIPSIRRETQATDKSTQLTISDIEYNTTVDDLKKTVTNPPDSESLDEYFNERPSEIPRFQELLKRTFVFNVRDDARKGLGFILAALNTRVGCLMLTGSATSFHEQPPHIRESILQRWQQSYLPPLNNVYSQMTRISRSLWYKTSPTFHKVSGFPPVPEHYKPGSHFEYDFMQFQPGTEPEIIETDVVIVGSGCGGAVAAKNLAEGGHKVVVVDKAYYYPPSQLPMSEEAGGIHLYDNGGADNSDDSSVTIVAGSSWGGGGTINWSASLQTQGYVRKEWAQDRGLTFFETAEFQNCLDRVCHRMGVSTEHIRHNHGNQVILEGSRKLGYHAKAVPQNTGGNEHYCGHCTVGCGAAQKQGPVVSWLPDAAKAGAKFMEGSEVHHVIFDESSGTKKAVGVKGTWTSRNSEGGVDGPDSGKTVREVIVRAKKVVISSGTLWSPIVLLNSGLTNPQIGQNLYLHPVNIVLAVFPEDVRPWEGGILTTVCTSFENLDGHGHGVKVETTAMLPSYVLTLANWDSGLDSKTQALKFRHMNGFISIARDRDTGRVYPDPVSGKPRYQYTPSAYDRAHVLEGVIAIAKICYVSGATEIRPCIGGVAPFIRNTSEMPSSSSDLEADPGITDPSFKAWLEALKRTGNKPPIAPFACAHQMGSNRMSVRPQDGVVDPKGKVWGTEDLYVADASVFPSASGVNPMVTNMAISDWISRSIGRELRGVEARL
ncbi:long chain fatty alcohol oxidase-like protein [Mollisia scopiformis]|uniref:Long-chain-alcohol oxidase n=1 Tax=Mollisia scopiformis TaxID=149040 RepID=A0A194WYQ5_MOLSC|nr:long chain fatty alcohol oxidase-like protein [Mollisia scopiformis]KUJ12732.1 long chain fatty alcohol oxidase-like protein [Mollisia scopiformis]